MANIIKCKTEGRRGLITNSGLNGIDYLEVKLISSNGSFQAILLVHFFNDKNVDTIDEKHLLILGGTRRKNIKIQWVKTPSSIGPNLKNELGDEYDAIKSMSNEEASKTLVVKSDDGDFSVYTLLLVDPSDSKSPPDGFDVQLSKIDFTFKIDCSSGFDCKQDTVCSPPVFDEPIIDYMAKDYSSFRRLMLDRIRDINPKWMENNPADLGIMLVELLAYVGDQLSYYQDAIATESYLGTARRRISLRRHARLLDYYINEGCNARAWTCFKIGENSGADGYSLRGGTMLCTGRDSSNPIIKKSDFGGQSSETKIFETMYDVTLRSENNEIRFHTWSDSNCWLPTGATSATLRNDGYRLYDNYLFDWNSFDNAAANILVTFLKRNFGLDWLTAQDVQKNNTGNKIQVTSLIGKYEISLNKSKKQAFLTINDIISYAFVVKKKGKKLNVYSLNLQVGDVLVFAEKRSPTTGDENDADVSHRQAIRLTKVVPDLDTIDSTPIVTIEWGLEDALAFPLCLWEFEPDITEKTFNNGGKQTVPLQPPTVSVNGIWVNVPDNISGAVLQFTAANNIYSKVIPPNLDTLITFDIPLIIQNVSLSIQDRKLATDVAKIGFITNKHLGSPQIPAGPLSLNPLDKIPLGATISVGNTLPISIAYGNVVLADHGYSKCGESIGNPPTDGRFYPKLGQKPLTFTGPNFNPSVKTSPTEFQSAASVFNYDPREAVPDIEIHGENTDWTVQKDLLESDESDRYFVVEMEDDGTAYVRFGDGIRGRKPIGDKLNKFTADYRVGNGSEGNVGVGTINNMILDNSLDGITKIWNPMEARGGRDPETLDEIRQYAPPAFRTQERAVTMDDYIDILTRHPEVKNAKAFLKWTGSWYTVFISIELFGGLEVDDAFKSKIKNYLDCYKLTCYDLEISKPQYVPLEISIQVCAKPGYFRDSIRQELLTLFSNSLLKSGQRGFFYPDNFTFGQPVYLSQIYDTAMKADGVESVSAEVFRRFGQLGNDELKKGFIKVGEYEIARLDNDRNFPENGKIDFIICGGM